MAGSPEAKVRVCNRPDCKIVIKPGVLACRAHWNELPPKLRDQLVNAWEQRKAYPDVPELVHLHRAFLLQALRAWGVTDAEMKTAMARAPRAASMSCPMCGAPNPMHRVDCPRIA